MLLIAIEILTVLATLAVVVVIGWFSRDVQSRGEGEWTSRPAPTPEPSGSYRVRLH
jgi:cytochrome b